jgi:hypothetical protein
LYIIQRHSVEIDPVIVAKVCTNIAELYKEKGYLNDSVRMYAKSLEFQQIAYPEYN